MIRIALTKGQFAIIDDADYEMVSRYRWRARWAKTSRSYYAVSRLPGSNGKCVTILMHRVILGLNYRDGLQGDHVNHDTLDNRRLNLRIASGVQNARNARKRSDNVSGFKGASAWKNKWKAQIAVDGEIIYLGLYDTPEAAHTAYCIAATKYHGEFACIGIAA